MAHLLPVASCSSSARPAWCIDARHMPEFADVEGCETVTAEVSVATLGSSKLHGRDLCAEFCADQELDVHTWHQGRFHRSGHVVHGHRRLRPKTASESRCISELVPTSSPSMPELSRQLPRHLSATSSFRRTHRQMTCPGNASSFARTVAKERVAIEAADFGLPRDDSDDDRSQQPPGSSSLTRLPVASVSWELLDEDVHLRMQRSQALGSAPELESTCFPGMVGQRSPELWHRKQRRPAKLATPYSTKMRGLLKPAVSH